MAKKKYFDIYDQMLNELLGEKKVLTIYYKTLAKTATTKNYYSKLLNNCRKRIKAIKKAINNQKLIDNISQNLYN